MPRRPPSRSSPSGSWPGPSGAPSRRRRDLRKEARVIVRTLDDVARIAATCTRCRLSAGRTQVVFGVGSPTADLMFIGEGPGYHEDKQGIPFVGAAGQLLTTLLSEIGVDRGDVYIA